MVRSRPGRAAPFVIALAGALTVAAGCRDAPTRPAAPALRTEPAERHALAEQVRALAAGRGIGPLASPPHVRPALVELGRALAFDRVLSGNRDISCMTCHLPSLGTGDARALSIGQGATGLGLARLHPTGAFIPRNAPPLFNLHALQSLFWDGRVSGNATSGYHTPAGAHLTPEMTAAFEFGPVSAQPMFPVLSHAEMRGDAGGPPGNELAAMPDADEQAIWRALMHRVGKIPEYRRLFAAAYPGRKFEELNFAHASNAIAGFFLERLTFTNSPWDRFLAGDDGALTDEQLAGARDFMSLKCSVCHNGPAFTDNQFHNVAVAQFGPGEGNGVGGHDDFGRFNVTGAAADRYAFRTPPLRNVELTGPYGHDGAFASLRDFVAHYSESELKLRGFDPNGLELALQGTLLNSADDIMATRDPIIEGVVLPDDLVDRLTAYMLALTDPAARHLGHIAPTRVPSGLPVDRR